MKQTTKEEQDEIWEEFYQEARDCVEWVDFTLDRESFLYLKNDYIILRKPKEEIKQ